MKRFFASFVLSIVILVAILVFGWSGSHPDGRLADVDRSLPLIDAIRTGNRSAIPAAMSRGLSPDTIVTNVGPTTDLSRGSEPDDIIATPLIVLAANYGRSEVVKLLVERGADVNAQTADGWTALMSAAEDGDVALMEFLLNKRAAVSLKTSNGDNAFTVAFTCHWNDKNLVPVLRLLLDHGADINSKDSMNHETALMSAAFNGSVDAVRLLLSRGARVGEKNPYGETAIQRARRCAEPSPEVIRLLKSAGAPE